MALFELCQSGRRNGPSRGIITAIALTLTVVICAACGQGRPSTEVTSAAASPNAAAAAPPAPSAKPAAVATGRDVPTITAQDVVPITPTGECRLLTLTTIAKHFGEPVSQGTPITNGCQWNAANGHGLVVVKVEPATERAIASVAGKTLPDTAISGVVTANSSGWLATSPLDGEMIAISIEGGSANQAGAVALLSEALRRRPSGSAAF